MLLIEHSARNLYREDAYRDYCWAVDAYGCYEPASFIYLCFEAFKDLAVQHGLRLVCRPPSSVASASDTSPLHAFPYKYEADRLGESWRPHGLIAPLCNSATLAEITAALSAGRNVIALIPTEALALWFRGDKAVTEAAEAATELGVPNAHERVKAVTTSNRDAIWWEELPVHHVGRLFVTRDCFLSDGYFMNGYGKTPENTARLNDLLREFAIFRSHLLRASIRNPVSVWPTNEPLALVIELFNHGPTVPNLEVRFNLPDSFEPMGAIERVLHDFKTRARTSLALQVIPRVDGSYSDHVSIVGYTASGEPIPVVCQQQELEVVPGFSGAARAQAKQDDETLSRLLSVLRGTDFYPEVSTLSELVRVDVRACLNRMRSVAEKLIVLAHTKRGAKLGDRTLFAAIQAAQESRMLSQRAIGYYHTIRVIGNLASHPADVQLTETDVRIVSYALACITDELIVRKLI